MERFLFSRLPVWVFLATLLLACIGMIGVAVLTHDGVAGPGRFGVLSKAAAIVGGRPEEIIKAIREPDPLVVDTRGRHEDRSGWLVSDDGPRPAGYVLLSRHDGDAGLPVVELFSLADMKNRFRWTVEIESLLSDANPERFSDPRLMTNALFRAIHPVAETNGDLIFKSQSSPLVRMSPCGETVWVQDGSAFHHSIERDADGNYWVPSEIRPNSFGEAAEFFDHGLALVSPEGEVLANLSVARLLIDHGLKAMLFTISDTGFDRDPVHLNDIEPVPGDGPFWKAGDVFISLRTPSMVALVRPATGELLWYRAGGPWMSQHDVDVIDDHTISVFSNNAYNMGRGSYIQGMNDVLIYDFETDAVTSPYRDALAIEEPLTVREGRSDFSEDGFLVVEETERGRLFVLRPDGTRYADFVNRAGNGKVYRMNWSRYLDPEAGEALSRALASVSCDAR